MTKKGGFNVDVYSCRVNIVVSNNIKRCINYHLKKAEAGTLDHAPSGYFFRPGEGRIGTYIIFFCKDDLCAETINHEKSHLVESILKDRNIHARGEVQAYLDGYVSSKIDEFFKKRKIKVPSKR